MTQGEIQQLLIVEDPRAAETYCQDYIPDCDAPLPYNTILTEAEEVSPLLTVDHRGKREIVKPRGKVSDKVHMAHSTHNTHCETSQVPNVVNPNCRLNGKGAPKVSFSKRKTITGIYGEFGRQI